MMFMPSSSQWVALRIYPNGMTRSPMKRDWKYYDDLFNEMRKRGMEPVVTLSHY